MINVKYDLLTFIEVYTCPLYLFILIYHKNNNSYENDKTWPDGASTILRV